MSSEEKKEVNENPIKEKEKEEENEDSGLAQFKDEALQKYIIEKALNRPETNCCTYNKGYITQECFVCMTCFQETKKRAVLCLGCSIKCHEDNHDIAPIGFKRHIRCDCGNNNYLIECKLKKKEEIEYDNPENVYNHNMENKYCFCDEEDDGNSTMAQCFFCEDWFHKEHLNIYGVNSEDNNVEELPNLDLVCKNCVKALKDILKGYDLKKFIFGLMPKEQVRFIDLTQDKENKENKEDVSLLGKKRNPPDSLDDIKEDKKEEKKEKEKEEKERELDDNINKDDEIKINNICKIKLSQENEEFFSQVIQKEQNLFIDCEIFLKIICHCEECSKKYNELNMNFLNDKNAFNEWAERKTFDDVINDEKFIEEAKKESQISISVENIEKTINDFFKTKEYRLLRVEQQVLIRAYIGELSNKFGEFLSTLDHTVITVEDIYNFINKYKDYFESLKQQ